MQPESYLMKIGESGCPCDWSFYVTLVASDKNLIVEGDPKAVWLIDMVAVATWAMICAQMQGEWDACCLA